jgi:hypothetical protein
MSLASARLRAQRTQQAALEAFRPEASSIIIQIGAQESSPLAAYVERAGLGWRPTDAGRAERAQTCYVHLRMELLPDWATEDAVTRNGKIQVDAQPFKVTDIRVIGETWRIVCIRWPNSND